MLTRSQRSYISLLGLLIWLGWEILAQDPSLLEMTLGGLAVFGLIQAALWFFLKVVMALLGFTVSHWPLSVHYLFLGGLISGVGVLAVVIAGLLELPLLYVISLMLFLVGFPALVIDYSNARRAQMGEISESFS